MSALSRCRLCPRECGADRANGRCGFCGAGRNVEVFTYGLHHGEEPPISGTNGSGTVFFSRCTLRCIYCQNYRWSQQGEGMQYDVDGLARIFRRLREQDCHNWNLVSPTPWLPAIVEAIRGLEQDGISLPIVYNTSGFENVRTLERLDGFVNVYLVDLRYADDDTAREASQAPAYVDTSRNAVREMWRQTGPLQLDKDGIARRGTICRLLILPGRAGQVVRNLEWLAGEFGTDMPVSVMSQYTPLYQAPARKGWNRRITSEEYDLVRDAVEHIGFSHGWIQEFGPAPSPELVGANMRPAAGVELTVSE